MSQVQTQLLSGSPASASPPGRGARPPGATLLRGAAVAVLGLPLVFAWPAWAADEAPAPRPVPSAAADAAAKRPVPHTQLAPPAGARAAASPSSASGPGSGNAKRPRLLSSLLPGSDTLRRLEPPPEPKAPP